MNITKRCVFVFSAVATVLGFFGMPLAAQDSCRGCSRSASCSAGGCSRGYEPSPAPYGQYQRAPYSRSTVARSDSPSYGSPYQNSVSGHAHCEQCANRSYGNSDRYTASHENRYRENRYAEPRNLASPYRTDTYRGNAYQPDAYGFAPYRSDAYPEEPYQTDRSRARTYQAAPSSGCDGNCSHHPQDRNAAPPRGYEYGTPNLPQGRYSLPPSQQPQNPYRRPQAADLTPQLNAPPIGPPPFRSTPSNAPIRSNSPPNRGWQPVPSTVK